MRRGATADWTCDLSGGSKASAHVSGKADGEPAEFRAEQLGVMLAAIAPSITGKTTIPCPGEMGLRDIRTTGAN